MSADLRTDRLLTARAVADMLAVSTETVLRWTRAGKLPAIRLPSGAVRYREHELESCLAAWSIAADDPIDEPNAAE